MQITPQNYFEAWEGIDQSAIPAALVEGHAYLRDMVNEFGWRYIEEDKDSKEVFERQARGLAPFLKQVAVPEAQPSKEAKAKPRKSSPAKEKSQKKSGGSAKSKAAKPAPKSTDVSLVRDLGVELQLMRRFVGLHGKARTRKQVLALFSALNRAIAKGHIRKTDNPTRFHAEMAYIQDRLVDALDNHLKKVKDSEVVILEFDEKEVKRIKGIVASFGVHPSVRLAVRFFGMEGKAPKIDNAQGLLDQIRKAVKSGKVDSHDPDFRLIKRLEAALADYVSKGSGNLRIEGATLQGLAGVVLGCPCQQGRGAKARRR